VTKFAISVAVLAGHFSRVSEEMNELKESVSAFNSFCCCAAVVALASADSAAELESLKAPNDDSKYVLDAETLTRFDVAAALAPREFFATTPKV
jgi:hypothetical protein